MSVYFESAARLNALKSGIEAKTGESYSDLTGGVNALIAGFGSGGGSGGVSLENVSVLVADFAETESLTVLYGAYYGTKQAIVS